jgi:hypothetical protein
MSEIKLKFQEKTLDSNQSRDKMEMKFHQQDKVIQHKQRQIDDLKETIRLKITVADDLSSIIKQ